MQEGALGGDFERLKLLNNYGSKMTKLIGWLKDSIKEDPNNRFILFSKVRDKWTLRAFINMILVHGLLAKSRQAVINVRYSVRTDGRVRKGNFKILSILLMIHRTGVQKGEKLKKFKEEDIQVILMSLEKSASGLNLIEANHVVLLDPMDGTVEEARATEIQALGRAHRQGQDQKVTLVRFIIQDSVEEQLYLRNKTTARGNAYTSQKGNFN